MPVSEAADEVPLEANHVYVIPQNVELTLLGGDLSSRRERKHREHICRSTVSFGLWRTSAEAEL